MNRYAERLIIAMIVASCALAALSTEMNFVSDVTRKKDVETNLNDDVGIYENVTFTVKQRVNTSREIREVEYEIYFVAFNKTFKLLLHECPDDTFSFRHPAGITITVIGPPTKSKTQRKAGRYFNHGPERRVSGYLINEPSSVFHGKYNNVSGMLGGVIHAADEVYYVRPGRYPILSLRLSAANKKNFRLVGFRERDVKLSATNNEKSSQQTGDSSVKVRESAKNNGAKLEARQHRRLVQTTGFRRLRRQASPIYKVCELTAVIHPTFYSTSCEGSITKTIDIVSLAVRRADRYVRRVDFNSDNVADNIGVVIKEIIIYTNESLEKERLGYYNHNSKHTLQAFSKFDFRESCLGVLFTHHTFDNNVVGLAYMGMSSRFAAPGGLCQKRKRFKKQLLCLNSLFVSDKNSHGQLSSLDLALTLTHEIGHAFGAPHDNEAECVSGGIFGMYLMHPTNMVADRPHSSVFSSCSILKMGPVIDSKGWCLKAYEADTYCGNSIREPGEECDCGRDGKYCRSVDRCCVPPSKGEPGCRIKREIGYVCSPSASPCCTDSCQVETEARVCLAATDCTRAAVCDSVSVECPEPVPLADGTLCAGGVRVCSGGQCVGSRCKLYGWIDCQCVHVHDELCQLCCAARNASGSVCKPAHRLNATDDLVSPIFLNVRDTCGGQSGYCDKMHKCLVAYPKDEEDIFGDIVQESSVELYRLLINWYFILLIAGLIVVFASLVAVYCTETTMSTMSYRSGNIASVWMVLGNQHSALSDQLWELKTHYHEKLYELEQNQMLDLVTGTARLSILFPTVKRTKIAKALKRSNCEEFAVRQLLLAGYPMKRDLCKSPQPV